MNVDLNIGAIEDYLRCTCAGELLNFDSSVVVGNVVYLFLDDELVGVQPYEFLLSTGAEA